MLCALDRPSPVPDAPASSTGGPCAAICLRAALATGPVSSTRRLNMEVGSLRSAVGVSNSLTWRCGVDFWGVIFGGWLGGCVDVGGVME